MMICLGNICRSPLAHGIMQDKIDKMNLLWSVESCGTSSWHVGEQPDSRSISIAKENGIDISKQRSQALTFNMLKEYDHLLAMDSSNYNDILKLAITEGQKNKVELLMNYAYPNENRQVPDPYYNGGFQLVFDMIAKAIDEFVIAHHK